MLQALNWKIDDKLDRITFGFFHPECRVVVASQLPEYDLPAGRQISRYGIEIALLGLNAGDLRHGLLIDLAFLRNARDCHLDSIRRAVAGHPAYQFAVGVARTESDLQQFVEGRGKQIRMPDRV